MPSKEDIAERLKAVVNDPDNQICSECDRSDNTAVWVAFFTIPVDRKNLAVACCKKCYKLFTKVQGAEFAMKNLDDLNDWTGDEVEALELGGNKLVNACYEAGVTKEKEGRDKRKYGYEAFFFEKYVNMSYFDEGIYKNLISQASKALVEKRFNKSLRGYNLKKTAAEEEDYSEVNDDDDDDDDDDVEESTSSHAENSAVPARARRSTGVQRANSARSIQSRRQIANRRHRSARNILLDGDKDSEGVSNTRPSMSRHRLNSIRRELMEEREDRKNPTKVRDISGDGNETDGRVRRSLSSRKLSGRNLVDGDDGSRGMRRVSSHSRIAAEDREARRSGAGEGMRRSGSTNRLDGEKQRGTLRSGRHRLSQRNVLA